MDKKASIDKAVNYIIDLKGELSEFFYRNRSEVYDMCITEYDEIKHLENVKQEGRIEGRTEGRIEGRTEEIFNSVREGDYSMERAAQKLQQDIDSVQLQYKEWLSKNNDK